MSLCSQKARISELEAQLDEERNQRRDERKNAAADLKSTLHKVKTEAQDEMKRQSDIYTRQIQEQEEKINKLQASKELWFCYYHYLYKRMDLTFCYAMMINNVINRNQRKRNEHLLIH